jgi:2-succinyl-6-hydroxy-2,4-cyclohexadiene-1-carboxylate synthase
MASRLLLLNGMRYHVELRGPPLADAGQRPMLALLHGFTGSAAGWGAHLDTFAAAGLPVIAFDLPGHGASDAPADPACYALERAREDIPAALAQLGVARGQAVLLGYSMGGRVALCAAISGFFRALVLESASPGLATAHERAERRASDEALAARIERDGVAAFVDEWERLPLFASQAALPADARAALRTERLRNSPTGLANSLRGGGTGAQASLWERLSDLAIPTLLLAGALDAKFTAIAERMATALPRATLRVVPGAGHAIHLERPSVFAALVLEFVNDLV